MGRSKRSLETVELSLSWLTVRVWWGNGGESEAAGVLLLGLSIAEEEEEA